jgi:hypothetical protein
MSKRRSDARSERSTLPPDSVIFFTDRGLGYHDVPDALRRAGLLVEAQQDHFNSDCDDATWVTEVGRRGWVILTKDKSFRTRQNEVAALMRANTAAFFLTNSSTTGAENAATFIKAIPQMLGLISSVSKPFLAQITPAGRVSIVLTHQMMIDLHGRLSR